MKKAAIQRMKRPEASLTQAVRSETLEMGLDRCFLEADVIIYR